jgi:intraflagellar transport protein 88
VFFERASLIEPNEVKWQLMTASCHRRSGNYQAAFDTYKRVHEKFPENIECLKFLVKICSDLGMKEISVYKNKLEKLESMNTKRNNDEPVSIPNAQTSLPQSVNLKGVLSSVSPSVTQTNIEARPGNIL